MEQKIRKETEQAIRESFSNQEFMSMTGSTLLRIDIGYAEIEMPKAKFLIRKSGIFHGGMVSMLVDCAAGYAASAELGSEDYLLTVELKVNFLRKAEGDRLLGIGKIIKSGRTLIITQVDVYACSGESNDKKSHVATALATLMKTQ
ncbi:MAG: PaaI family thioesterase [Prolixibacteraceae bacterium]